MKFNEESFKKALTECKIIRWQNIFKQVVKAYLKEEEKQLTLTDVVKSFTAEQVGDMLANKFTTIEEAIHYFDNLK